MLICRKQAHGCHRRLKKKFNERNIEFPFPHVNLYLGQDKKGEAPPLRVLLEGGQNEHSRH